VSKSLSMTWWKLAIIAITVAIPAAIVMSYGLSWFQRPPESDAPQMLAQSQQGRLLNTPMFFAGLRMPATVDASHADLKDEESVIGVSAGGKQRAYRVKAMVPVVTHVINDLLGDVPVTVTYDDRNDKVQVFTCDTTGRPMDVEMRGYYNGMLIRSDGRMIRQDTGRLLVQPGEEGEQALTIHPHTRTDWKTWRTTFPDTDAYVGQASDFMR